MADEPNNPDIPGDWHGPLSLRPLKEAMRFVQACDDYTKELRHQHGTPVFKGHPGIKSTFITDMAGLEFVFGAAPEELDRLDDEEAGFGGLSFNRHQMLNGVVPALMAHSATHGPARALIVEAVKLRRNQFIPACQKVHDYGIPMLREPARRARSRGGRPPAVCRSIQRHGRDLDHAFPRVGSAVG